MSKIRVNKTKDYTVLSNHHLKNKNLSLKAKGLLSVMLSLPDDWDYSINGLSFICKENETAITSALDELKENGYLVVTKLMPNQTSSGRYEYLYDIYEQPLQKQEVEKQGVEFLGLENMGLNKDTNILNTNIINTKELIKDNIKEKNTKKETKLSLLDNYTDDEELKNALLGFIEMRNKTKGFTTRAFKLALTELDKLALDDYTKTQIVNQSVMRGWKSFYALKNINNAKAQTERIF